mgnify:CR=1 FL=1
MAFKILILINNVSDRSIILDVLGDYPTLTAESGEEAMMTLAADSKINLLLLDLKISDAFHLLESLKADERFKNLRTIILTDQEEPENEIQGLRLGATDYARKPIVPESFKARVDMHIAFIRAWEALEKENEKILERSKSVFLHHLPGLAYRCDFDRDWTMRYVSEGCYNLTGYPPESLLYNRDLSYNDIIAPEYREFLWDRWHETIMDKRPFKYEYEIITASGEKKWVIELGQPIFDASGDVEALEGIVLDISDRKAIEDVLKYNNEHHRWTGLYNRDYLETVFAEDVKKDRQLKRAFVGINLSAVEVLTAQYGFQYTQNLIIKAAENLSKYITHNRPLFHTNQSRFAFYVMDYKDQDELIEFSQSIAKEMNELFMMERIGGGIAVIEFDIKKDKNLDRLLRHLLAASERAISIPEKNFNICFYNDEIKAAVNREREITDALHAVVEGNDSYAQFYLQFQPIVDLKDDHICCFEALARLKTKNLGMVSPVEFIPLAEKTKLILPLGERVIIESFNFLNKLKEHGHKDICISINVSLIQLLNNEFTDNLFALMRKMNVNPKRIVIEITESVFSINYDAVNNLIERCHDAGMYVAIDDFGTGYSSLARERELKVNCIKIAKEFIDRLAYVSWDRVITGDIISMAHRLGHCIIAEGVEQEIQLQYLKEHNCDRIQGYIISKPVDEQDALEMLASRQKNT